MNKDIKIRFFAVLLVLASLCAGCDGSGSLNDADPGNASSFNATGLWDGYWESNDFRFGYGYFNADIVQTGSQLTGTITIFDIDIEDVELTGTVYDDYITFGDISGMITFSGFIDIGDTAEGTYVSSLDPAGGSWEAWCTRVFKIEKIISTDYPIGTTGLTCDSKKLYIGTRHFIDIYDFDGSAAGYFLYQEPIRDFKSLAYDGEYFWGSDLENDVICKINSSGSVVAEFISPGYPHNAAGPIQVGIATDGERIWVLDYNTKKIHRMDKNGNFYESFIYTEDEYNYPTGLGYARGYLWLSNGDGLIYKIDPATGSMVSQYVLPESDLPYYSSWPGDITFDGKDMWIADYERIVKISEQ